MFENVKLPRGQYPELRLRLVEHRNHPGLAIFLPKDGNPPVKFWKEHGKENDVPFMLLCPHDKLARHTLVAAISSDLAFVLDSAAFIEDELSGRLEVNKGHSHPPRPHLGLGCPEPPGLYKGAARPASLRRREIGLEKAPDEWKVTERLAPASFREVRFPTLEWRWLVPRRRGHSKRACGTPHAPRELQQERRSAEAGAVIVAQHKPGIPAFSIHSRFRRDRRMEKACRGTPLQSTRPSISWMRSPRKCPIC